jgi:hypothetical protein
MFEPHHVDAYVEIAGKLAKAFSDTNPNFKPDVFIAACTPRTQST